MPACPLGFEIRSFLVAGSKERRYFFVYLISVHHTDNTLNLPEKNLSDAIVTFQGVYRCKYLFPVFKNDTGWETFYLETTSQSRILVRVYFRNCDLNANSSSDRTVAARKYEGTYFISMLLCNSFKDRDHHLARPAPCRIEV